MISPQQAKEISIVQYMVQQGCVVRKVTGGQHFFFSPFREEKDPSFVVREGGGKDGEDVWVDFGANSGGDIIELVKTWKNYSFQQTLKHLADYYKSNNFRVETKSYNNPSLFETSSSIKVTAVRPLNHFVLLNYLEKKRGISKAIAQKYLKLVWYETSKAKNLFAFGWENNSGAYELRSGGEKVFKSVTGRKDITFIPYQDATNCFIFEGMIDFLSVLELKKIQQLEGDVIILNSTTLRKRLIYHLSKKIYDKIYTFFDNDDAGQTALAYLQEYSVFPFEQQTFYKSFKDVNEYWQSKSLS